MITEQNELLPKILVCRSDGPGGVAHYYRELGKYFPLRVSFFLVHDPKENRLIGKIGKLFFRLPRFIMKVLKNDVICLNPSLYPSAYYRDMLFLLIAKIMRRKVVVFFRGWSLPFEEKITSSRIRRLVFSISYGNMDAAIVLGDLFKMKLGRLGIPANRILVETTTAAMPEGFQIPHLKSFIPEKRQLRILFLARIAEGKGWKESLDFTKTLADRIPDWNVSLIMAGDGERKDDAVQYANEIGLSCHFPGRVGGVEKAKLYSESDVFILLSASEGLPNNILEAMLFGMIVVASPVGAIPEVVVDGQNGFIIDSVSLDVVDRLIECLTDRVEAERMMNKNMTTARKRFLPDQCAMRIMRIMDTVFEGGSPNVWRRQ